MSALYGKVSGDDKPGVTRPAHHEITAWLQTERGRVTVSLKADGTFRVFKEAVYQRAAVGGCTPVATGNVEE